MFWFIVGIVAALLLLMLIHVFLVVPLRFIRFYRAQGIGGLPFKLFFGQVKEIQQVILRVTFHQSGHPNIHLIVSLFRILRVLNRHSFVSASRVAKSLVRSIINSWVPCRD
jgi:hypothetical protein